jgi:hypothetical protein
MNNMMDIFSQSLLYRGFLVLNKIFKQSYLYLIPKKTVDYVGKLYQESYTHHYFHTNRSFFTPLFRNGLFVQLITQLFVFTGFFITLIGQLWSGSCTEKLWDEFKADCSSNYLRYLSTFLFVSVIIYSIITIISGSGYTRGQMLTLVGVVFILFGFTQLKGKTNEYLTNSVIIQWIQKIYL